MVELLLHLIGDYVLQTEQMALNKVRSWFWSLVHATVYTLPFLILIRTWQAAAVILLTHAVIDRLALARVVYRLKNRLWFGPGRPDHEPDSGFALVTPEAVRFWLIIIVDNTLHMTINHLVLRYMNGV